MKSKYFLLLILLFFGCEKKEEISIEKNTEKCKLTKAVLSSSKVIEYNHKEGTLIDRIKYRLGQNLEYSINMNLTHNAKGELTNSEWFFGTEFDNKETYTYSQGKIARVDWENYQNKKGWNRIEYNQNGLISKFTFEGESTNSNLYPYNSFEYDSDKRLTKTSFYDKDGILYQIKIVKPTSTLKSPEWLLLQYGIPYDLYEGNPLKAALGGNGTIVETYEVDANGKETLVSQGEVYGAVIDNNGYLTDYKIDVKLVRTPYTNITSYTLQDCSI